jgi:membrane fusion protein, heavy metal efflux system
MKQYSILLVILLMVVPACQTAPSHAAEEPHAEHAAHDEHADKEHDHDEHGGGPDKDKHAGEGAEHDDHESEAEKKPASDDSEEEGTVRLSASALKRSGIRVAPVTTGALNGMVEVPAEVQLNPDRVAHISPLVEGQLLRVDVTIGDRVKEKEALAQLRSVALGQGRAELSRTNALHDLARQNLERQQQLRADGISSERSLLEAKFAFDSASAERDAALSRLRVFGSRGGAGPDMTLVSPIAGVILDRHATRGENVSPADTLFVVADTSQVWVIGRAYEKQIARVKSGMQATLSLNAFPSRTWSGTVNFVGASIDEETRTLPIRVELDNADGLLRPGLFGTLRLSSAAESGTVVVVPDTALQTMENRPVVFVPGHEDGEFELRNVTVGTASQGKVEVLEGLKSGDSVVVEGGFVLKSELMRAELGHGHAH